MLTKRDVGLFLAGLLVALSVSATVPSVPAQAQQAADLEGIAKALAQLSNANDVHISESKAKLESLEQEVKKVGRTVLSLLFHESDKLSMKLTDVQQKLDSIDAKLNKLVK